WARASGKVEGWTDPAQECAQTPADRPYPDRFLGQRRHRSAPKSTRHFRPCGTPAASVVDSPGAPTARAPADRRRGRNRKGGELTVADTRIGSGYPYSPTRCALGPPADR